MTTLLDSKDDNVEIKLFDKSGKTSHNGFNNNCIVIKDIASMRNICMRHKLEGYYISFVPTMGALHNGHLKLVEEARLVNTKTIVIVSIFVNPKQFNKSDDYVHYPRTFDTDLLKCDKARVDYIFAPQAEEMFPNYPDGREKSCCMIVAGDYIGKILEGSSRPGHFSGMLTVVTKFLNIIQPNKAYFGVKDYQQLLLVTRLVDDLNIDTEIYPVETVREDNGCALSSRNKRLDKHQHQRAAKIYKILMETKYRLESSKVPFDAKLLLGEVLLEKDPNKSLIIDYFEVRCAKCLNCISCQDKPRVQCAKACNRDVGPFEAILLIACYVDEVRLIDNMKLLFV